MAEIVASHEREESALKVLHKPLPVDPTKATDLVKFRGKPLSDEDRDYLEDLIRGLSIEKSSIREAMGFSLDHAESAPEVTRFLIHFDGIRSLN